MMFVAKKVVSFFIMPLPLTLLLCTLGLCLMGFTNRQRLAKRLTTVGVLLLAVASCGPISNSLIKPLESSYTKYEASENFLPTFVVVLGSGHGNDAREPLSSRIAGDAIVRLTEGIMIHNQHPDSILVLSGYAGHTDVTHAQLLAQAAIGLGVDPKKIIKEPRARDTAEEAQFIGEIVDSSPFVLVTSATHMPRAMALFKARKMHPVAAPTAYKYHANTVTWKIFSPGALRMTHWALHEYLGRLWSNLRRQI